jgi:hypothetical protein
VQQSMQLPDLLVSGTRRGRAGDAGGPRMEMRRSEI